MHRHASLFGGVAARNQCVVAHILILLRPSVAALVRLDLMEQFPCPADGAIPDADRHLHQFFVLGLFGVEGECGTITIPQAVLPPVDPPRNCRGDAACPDEKSAVQQRRGRWQR